MFTLSAVRGNSSAEEVSRTGASVEENGSAALGRGLDSVSRKANGDEALTQETNGVVAQEAFGGAASTREFSDYFSELTNIELLKDMGIQSEDETPKDSGW